MLGRLVDKLFFATLLLIALQIPILADHYRQFISGKVDTLQTQVDAYQAQATKHGFASVDAMLSALLDNESALVREDARFKTEQIKLLMQTREGLHVLTHGNYFEKAVYCLDRTSLLRCKKSLRTFLQPYRLTHKILYLVYF